ncbi:MAG: peptidoglycan D,D-transpeptidase FtsI family protein [Acidimicrobiales bacterium]
MERRIGWLGILIVLCFVVLFTQLNYLQVVKAHQYATAPGNPAVIQARYDQPRGDIQSADGMLLAQSVPIAHACSTCYKYQRRYPSGSLFSQVVGYDSYIYSLAGAEASYNQYLVAHNRPVKSLGDLLTTPTVSDTVTLTLSAKLQQVAQQALGGRDGAVVMLAPSTGAILAMYSNPTFDPNPLASQDTNATNPSSEQAAWSKYVTRNSYGFEPLSSLAYQDDFPPGSTFKIVTTSAAYEHAPQLLDTPMPAYSCIPPGTLKGQTTPLCNYGNSYCGGTIAQMLPPSCDTGYALLGTKIGDQSMSAEARSFGFNQQPPIDLPHSPYEISQFLQPSCYQNAQIFLAFSSIGQKCTVASPLQMALVAAGIADGGVVMTPHVMSQIRDSQGALVVRYHPTPWLTPTSSQTAAAITKLMTEVVTSPDGTAAGVGFLPQDDVAAKTGTAQIGVGNTATTDWMIAFAPASAPKIALAVVLPHQAASGTGAEVAGPVMKTMIEAALAGR